MPILRAKPARFSIMSCTHRSSSTDLFVGPFAGAPLLNDVWRWDGGAIFSERRNMMCLFREQQVLNMAYGSVAGFLMGRIGQTVD
jgi:hypothetical protein